MSTRALIGRLNEDGSVKAIYLHADGYPKGAGWMLMAFYQDEGKLEELLALGNLSTLAPLPGEKHPWVERLEYARNKAWSTAYIRDRGENEAMNAAMVHRSVKAYEAAAKDDAWIEWVYLFTPEGWQFFKASAYWGKPERPTWSSLAEYLE